MHCFTTANGYCMQNCFFNFWILICFPLILAIENILSNHHVTQIVALIWKEPNKIPLTSKNSHNIACLMTCAQRSSLTLSLFLSIVLFHSLACSCVVVIVRACSGVTMPNSNQSTDKRLLSFFAWFCVYYYMFPFHQHVLKSRSAML